MPSIARPLSFSGQSGGCSKATYLGYVFVQNIRADAVQIKFCHIKDITFQIELLPDTRRLQKSCCFTGNFLVSEFSLDFIRHFSWTGKNVVLIDLC